MLEYDNMYINANIIYVCLDSKSWERLHNHNLTVQATTAVPKSTTVWQVQPLVLDFSVFTSNLTKFFCSLHW